MALPGHTFTVEQVKFRRGEKYVSLAANQQFLGVPYGVYVGLGPEDPGVFLEGELNSGFRGKRQWGS